MNGWIMNGGMGRWFVDKSMVDEWGEREMVNI